MKNDGRESKTARKMAQVGWPSFDFSLGLSSLRNQTETLATHAQASRITSFEIFYFAHTVFLLSNRIFSNHKLTG